MIENIVLSVFLVVYVVDQVVSDFDDIVVEVDVAIRERVEARHQPAYQLRMADLGLVQNLLGFQVQKLELVHLFGRRSESIDLRENDHSVFDGVNAELEDCLVHGTLSVNDPLAVIRVEDLHAKNLLAVNLCRRAPVRTAIQQEEKRGVIELLEHVARARRAYFHVITSRSFVRIGHDARIHRRPVLHENDQDLVQIHQLFVRGAPHVDLFEGLVFDLR